MRKFSHLVTRLAQARELHCPMHDLPLLTTIAAAFASAWVLGLITQRIGLSPIVGYLLAGIVIGPYTAGFVGDVDLAQQLAELGVILMMFGVGLHFHLKDLLAVKRIAIPGAIGQSLVATILTLVIFHFMGWPLKSAAVLGIAMAVASTVVLLRVLMDKGMLSTSHGHAAVGWLIVEDIFTVLALVLVPIMGTPTAEVAAGADPAVTAQTSGLVAIGWALLKLAALVAIVLFGGSRVVPWILSRVARLRSQELFTLTVLVLSIAVAVGSASLFGASVALGAFLAGMVVAQSPASHQAASDILPLRDAFSVLFFVAVGMLFDPAFLLQHPLMVVAGLSIVLIAKPLSALFIVAVLGYPVRTALTVALGLAQIGEFSFILAQVAKEHGLMPTEGTQTLIATAMISITLNPLLFGSIDKIEDGLKKWPRVWKILNAGSEKREAAANTAGVSAIQSATGPLAVIIGYGPAGRVVDALLRDAGVQTVICDMNIQTIENLTKHNRPAIFGDASRYEVLEQTGIRRAVHVVLTLSQSTKRAEIVRLARRLNATVEITVRAHYLTEREALEIAGATKVVYEEGEAGVALARHVMEKRGVDPTTLDKMLVAIRKIWRMHE